MGRGAAGGMRYCINSASLKLEKNEIGVSRNARSIVFHSQTSRLLLCIDHMWGLRPLPSIYPYASLTNVPVNATLPIDANVLTAAQPLVSESTNLSRIYDAVKRAQAERAASDKSEDQDRLRNGAATERVPHERAPFFVTDMAHAANLFTKRQIRWS